MSTLTEEQERATKRLADGARTVQVATQMAMRSLSNSLDMAKAGTTGIVEALEILKAMEKPGPNTAEMVYSFASWIATRRESQDGVSTMWLLNAAKVFLEANHMPLTRDEAEWGVIMPPHPESTQGPF